MGETITKMGVLAWQLERALVNIQAVSETLPAGGRAGALDGGKT
jgi:hypothetical protein